MKEKIVCVDWIDSCSSSGWQSRKSLDEVEVSKCQSVGYLIRKNRTELTISQSTSKTTGQVGDLISIPRKCIKRVVYLKE